MIEFAQAVEHRAAIIGVDAGGVREDRGQDHPGAKADALILGRQEAAAPEAREERLIVIESVGLREHDDERREVVVLAAESVADPRAQTGTSGLLASRFG